MKPVTGLFLICTALIVAPAAAQKCLDYSTVYLLTGDPPKQLTAVGCRLNGETSNCSTAPQGQRELYDAPEGKGNCHLCLQSSQVDQYGRKVAPKTLAENGAIGLFRQFGRAGSPYAVDLDCLQEDIQCENLWALYNCKSCVSSNYLHWDTWRFDDDFAEYWSKAANQAGKANTPEFTAGVRNAAVSFTQRSQYLEYADEQISLDGIADGNFSVEGWIRTKNTGTQVIASKRIENGESGPFQYLDPALLEAMSVSPFEAHSEVIRFSEESDRDMSCTCPAKGYCGIQLITSDRKIGLQLSHGGKWRNFIAPKGNIADGKWRHFAITVDRKVKDGIKFYINGEYVGSKNPTAITGCLSNDANLFIGGQSKSTNFAFVGDLDELSVHLSVLPKESIQMVYEAKNHGYCYPN